MNVTMVAVVAHGIQQGRQKGPSASGVSDVGGFALPNVFMVGFPLHGTEVIRPSCMRR